MNYNDYPCTCEHKEPRDVNDYFADIPCIKCGSLVTVPKCKTEYFRNIVICRDCDGPVYVGTHTRLLSC